MKNSFEGSVYEIPLDDKAETPEELEEGKKMMGGRTKSRKQSLADMLAHAEKTNDKILATNAKNEIISEYLGGKPESKELPEVLNFEQIKDWLKEKGIDFDLEKAVDGQEKFWQKIYGSDFKIDRSKIIKEKKFLKAIEKGFEVGCFNGIGIVATSELSEEEAQMTAFQQAFHKLLESGGMNIWKKTGTERWTKLELEELMKRALPVECSDFNIDNLNKDYVKEFIRIIKEKGPTPKQKSNKVEFFFTDTRQDIPKNQKLVNMDGEVVENPHSFVGAIANKISFTNPEEQIVLARQMYEKDKSYISEEFWEWLMAIVDHSDKNTKPPVSSVSANSNGGELILYSYNADSSDGNNRFRAKA